MGGTWRLEESRLVQERSAASAADADVLTMTGVVPAGRLWVITGVAYIPDVAETQVISFYKVTSSGAPISLLNPISLALNPARATFIEQGMEYLLFPGEYLQVRRQAHTAGSVMSTTVQIIEIDQPLYTYDEPQVVRRQQRAISSMRSALGGGGGRGGAGASSPTPTSSGGGGTPRPV